MRQTEKQFIEMVKGTNIPDSCGLRLTEFDAIRHKAASSLDLVYLGFRLGFKRGQAYGKTIKTGRQAQEV